MLRLDLSANGVEAVDGVAAELEEGLALAPPPAPAPPAAPAGAAAAGGGAQQAAGGGVGGGGVRVLDALWAAALCGMPHLMELELRDSGGACVLWGLSGVVVRADEDTHARPAVSYPLSLHPLFICLSIQTQPTQTKIKHSGGRGDARAGAGPGPRGGQAPEAHFPRRVLHHGPGCVGTGV